MTRQTDQLLAYRERLDRRREDHGSHLRHIGSAQVPQPREVFAGAANDLFPTPAAIAELMVEHLDLVDGATVLEPSAGTGQLIAALPTLSLRITAIEEHSGLCESLEERAAGLGLDVQVIHDDFLDWQLSASMSFDAIIMNPPFRRGSDIKHILAAAELLRPGGRLVALCADGPRQEAKLQALATSWQSLPAGAFSEQGTQVRVALLTIDA